MKKITTPVTYLLEQPWVLATHNPGKVKEFASLLAPLRVPLNLFEGTMPEETGATFAENALIKAHAAAHQGLPALADDSGFCIPQLGDFPGVRSARYLEACGGLAGTVAALEQKIPSGAPAAFVCVLALVDDASEHLFEGRVDGHVHFPPCGEGGFGYDPIFTPQGFQQTFGEMPATEKNKISHRAVAVRKLLAAFGHTS